MYHTSYLLRELKKRKILSLQYPMSIYHDEDVIKFFLKDMYIGYVSLDVFIGDFKVEFAVYLAIC